jgi:hypothetical protein
MLDVGKVVILKNGCEYTEGEPQCSSTFYAINRSILDDKMLSIVIIILIHNITTTLISAATS